jgi:hypothetical protein
VAVVKAAVATAIAHPIITGIGLAASMTMGGINAANAGYNIFQGIGIGLLSGVAGLGVGSWVGGAVAGAAGPFWGTLAGAAAGGAAGGFTAGFGSGLSSGASFGESLAFGGLSALVGAGTSAALAGATYGTAKVVSAIRQANAQARASGVKTPVGQQGKGSTTSSLNANKGDSASRSQALSSRGSEVGNSDQIDRIVIRKSDAEAYRQGVFGESNIKGGQWAPENPVSTPDYAQKYGLPAENSGKPDWVVKGRIVGEYGQGPAPASNNNPANTGGATEIRPNNPDDVQLEWFHMPDD